MDAPIHKCYNELVYNLIVQTVSTRPFSSNTSSVHERQKIKRHCFFHTVMELEQHSYISTIHETSSILLLTSKQISDQ